MKFIKILAVALLVVAVGLFAYKNELSQKQNAPEDGEYFGFIRSLNSDEVNFDGARWLNGKEGEDAAIRAGVCTEETRTECLPNNFFIDNSSKDTRKIQLDSSLEIRMATWRMEELGVTETPITLGEFREAINNSELHWSQLPYRISISNGRIVKISEVYLP